MSETAKELASRYELATQEFVDSVSRLSPDVWARIVPEEKRTVGALVHHVAWAWGAESRAFREIAEGAPGSGWTAEWLDQLNAEQGERFAKAGRDDMLELLTSTGAEVAIFICGLTDDQLERIGTHMPDEPPRTVEGWIEVCLIGHSGDHLPAIMAMAQSD